VATTLQNRFPLKRKTEEIDTFRKIHKHKESEGGQKMDGTTEGHIQMSVFVPGRHKMVRSSNLPPGRNNRNTVKERTI
jgi:hypothetical protein